MNTEVSAVTGFPPYEMVFGRKPRANYFLLESLYEQSIMQEEDLPNDLDVEPADEEPIQQEIESNSDQQQDRSQQQDNKQRQQDNQRQDNQQ